ncbi:hypothetical protein C4552_03775 [Candidatus Parcubacteria bacterium]|nr:MAG: hypothetical protein C4552_03775 [Candidatus Parcubacteria bacterium]
MPRALLSVYKKDEPFLDFARALHERGWELVSSGGTAKFLAKAGFPVTDVAGITGEPAMLDHRVVTLHPKIHGGLITGPEQEIEREERGIPRFDLLCVGLYPLEEAIALPDATEESVLALTDIGGPAMLRSAAKGRRLIVSSPKDYGIALAAIESPDLDSFMLRRRMAGITEGRVARYSLDSARFLSRGAINGFIGERVQECAYGENPWQSPAAHYAGGWEDPLALHNFKQLAGNAPSYNNLVDADAVLQTTTHIAAVWDVNRGYVPYIAVADKHTNPCGAAVSSYRDTAVRNMIDGDPIAIFGGFMGFNFPVDDDIAELLLTHGMPPGQRRVISGIMAPAFTDSAVERLERKKGECRFLANQALENLSRYSLDTAPRMRSIRGGWVTQPNYTYVLNLRDPDLKYHDAADHGMPPLQDEDDMMLAWAVGSTSFSNTISIVRNRMLIGNGVGQKDRWFGAHIAVLLAQRAGHSIAGAAAYSDSFFPFPDGAEVLRDAGVHTLLASTGSIRDKSVLNAFCQDGRRMITAPDRKIRGFRH